MPLVPACVDSDANRLYWPGMKAFLVDTVATIVFFTVVAAVAELVFVGLEPQQVLIARVFMVPVMVVTGRPYGVWRDWIFRRFRPRRQTGRFVTDTSAFITFQIPVYLASLAIVGATVTEMAAAVGTAVVGMALLSRPFGVFLDAVRRRAGVAVATTSGPS